MYHNLKGMQLKLGFRRSYTTDWFLYLNVTNIMHIKW